MNVYIYIYIIYIYIYIIYKSNLISFQVTWKDKKQQQREKETYPKRKLHDFLKEH